MSKVLIIISMHFADFLLQRPKGRSTQVEKLLPEYGARSGFLPGCQEHNIRQFEINLNFVVKQFICYILTMATSFPGNGDKH